MANPIQIRVYDRNQLVLTEEFEQPVELGRQSEAREGLYSKRFDGTKWRVVIASVDEDAVPRKHTLLEPIAEGRIRVSNLSSVIPLRLPEGDLAPKASGEIALPQVLSIGRKTVRIQAAENDQVPLQALAEATMAPGRFSPSARPAGLGLPSAAGGIDAESLVRWLQAVVGVLQNAASSSDFFRSAAQAVVEIIGLDSGRVLILDQENWRIQAIDQAPNLPPEPRWQPSRNILSRLRRERRTLWQEPDQTSMGLDPATASLIGISAVVVAPILSPQGEVIGALYGERRQGARVAESPRLMKVDAMLMELLSSGVANGLARLEQEKAALAARVQFEQFFTPELASELAARPDLLKGRNLEVTLLFCDIRGFSRISERLGPAGTVEWIGDVMTALSDCVLAHQGVLVDYIGDELIAMWAAPKEEPAHASLTCRAALDMLEQLVVLNQRWQPTLKESMGLGIGINTGIAQVGNTGSHHKFKYGALGNTVNLASRVQGATKYLKTKLVVTGTTHAQLDSGFPSRRLCKVEVVNIAEPVDLYELAPQAQAHFPALGAAYEDALAAFENRDFRSSTRILGNLLGDYPEDGPSLVLLSRAVNCLVEEPTDFDPVWKLPGK